MFDRSACAKVRLAAEPHTDLSALVMLVALLRDVRNVRSAAPDAPASGVSLSGDRNRREHYATPEQAEVGTPLCVAANRPVRKERADNGRHAGLSGLPMETRAALTTLMTRLILDHADKRQVGLKGDDHDL